MSINFVIICPGLGYSAPTRRARPRFVFHSPIGRDNSSASANPLGLRGRRPTGRSQREPGLRSPGYGVNSGGSAGSAAGGRGVTAADPSRDPAFAARGRAERHLADGAKAGSEMSPSTQPAAQPCPWGRRPPPCDWLRSRGNPFFRPASPSCLLPPTIL